MNDASVLKAYLETWMHAWNTHDIEGVLDAMTDDIEFSHWNGHVTKGKERLRKLWEPWFRNHGGFFFDVSTYHIDADNHSAFFAWRLTWPSPEASFRAQPEIREGIDMLVLRDGKIAKKSSYIKTQLTIADKPVVLRAVESGKS